MMTLQEVQKIMHQLGLDYEPEAKQIYVFYQLPDGRIDNFSISVRRGRQMTDSEIVEMMQREYPATRSGKVLSVERPAKSEGRERVGQEEEEEQWLDTRDVCEMLHISVRTLRNWTRRGYMKAHRLDRRLYYSRREVDQMLRNHAVQENGHLDLTALD